MREENKQTITWLTVNNLVPLITSAVMITLSFTALNTRLSVIESKMDAVLANQEKQEKIQAGKFYDIETRYGNLSIKVAQLEAGTSAKVK